jgi:hypothetical protein
MFAALFALIVALFATQVRAQEDPYSETVVSDAMTTHIVTSVAEKQLSRLGDRAAIAVVRSTGEQGFDDLDKANRVLSILRTAFSVPQNIQVPADRTPQAALFLLHCIRESSVGSELAVDIETTKRAILPERP